MSICGFILNICISILRISRNQLHDKQSNERSSIFTCTNMKSLCGFYRSRTHSTHTPTNGINVNWNNHFSFNRDPIIRIDIAIFRLWANGNRWKNKTKTSRTDEFEMLIWSRHTEVGLNFLGIHWMYCTFVDGRIFISFCLSRILSTADWCQSCTSLNVLRKLFSIIVRLDYSFLDFEKRWIHYYIKSSYTRTKWQNIWCTLIMS